MAAKFSFGFRLIMVFHAMLPLHIVKLYPIVLCMRIYAKVQQEINRKICYVKLLKSLLHFSLIPTLSYWYFQTLFFLPVLITDFFPSRRWASCSSELYYIGLYFIVHTWIAWLHVTFKVLVPIPHTLSRPISRQESGWLLFCMLQIQQYHET